MSKKLPVTEENIKLLSHLTHYYKPRIVGMTNISFESELMVPVYVEINGEVKRRFADLRSRQEWTVEEIELYNGTYENLMKAIRDFIREDIEYELNLEWVTKGVTPIEPDPENRYPIEFFELCNCTPDHEQPLKKDAELLKKLHQEIKELTMNKKEVVDVETVTKTFCDSCGKLLSDGTSDSWGRISFSGVWAEMEKGGIEEMVVKRDGIGRQLYKFNIETVWEEMGSWVFCKGCAESLKDELNERFC